MKVSASPSMSSTGARDWKPVGYGWSKSGEPHDRPGFAQHDRVRQIRYQSAEQDSAEESPSSIDLLGDEIAACAIAILFGSAARCAPLGTSASAVSIIARNWTSRKAIP